MTELCFYTGVATLSLLFGIATVINPIGAGLLALGVYGHVKQQRI